MNLGAKYFRPRHCVAGVATPETLRETQGYISSGCKHDNLGQQVTTLTIEARFGKKINREVRLKMRFWSGIL